MLSRSEWWELLEPSVEAEGLKVFDIDVPSGARGVLRVTIQKPKGPKEPVDIEDCARVSRRISALDRFEDLIPDSVTLEVSSPGIERKLRRIEHFIDAIGERVRVKYFDPSLAKARVAQGVLQRASESEVVLLLDSKALDSEGVESRNELRIASSELQDGKVLFVFEDKTPKEQVRAKKSKGNSKKG